MGDEYSSRSRKRRDLSDVSSSSDDSSSEDEERRRKRKRKEKKRSKHHSKDRKHRKRKHRRRHHSSSDSDESSSSDSESESERRKKKKLLRDAKKLLKEAKRSEKSEKLEDRSSAAAKKVEDITEDDYFLKNNEFSSWLKETRNIYFSSLTTEEARRLFTKFVDEWNAGRLHEKYYEGINTVQRTNHRWHIRDEAEEAAEKEERWMKNKKREKLEQKKFQREHELVMDELLPKATGKERQFEKKSIERQKNKARELSPEPMRESDMMGTGDDFKKMLAMDRARREKRANAKAEQLHKKLSVVEERETAAMDQFRALVNTSGGKITIPKRE